MFLVLNDADSKDFEVKHSLGIAGKINIKDAGDNFQHGIGSSKLVKS